jgi:hypothetical protein
MGNRYFNAGPRMGRMRMNMSDPILVVGHTTSQQAKS